ncbi:hypothetical protein Pyrde_1894 [Pyrodictium delaneyi]|uniref:Uncharacterized protein n=1 Tax=Pyrodictium delaneyi TaxID=1273541 RepID=A0A0N7JDE1_9CREN|nr:hypothetical protein [Pyrodictium delaneyi]ALL01937.1 hypothetical protein Pyrde_1894 [Pyrodictium delaneyi]
MTSRLAIPSAGYTRQRLVVMLRDSMGLSWGAIAEIVYGSRNERAKLKAYALYATAKKKEHYTPGNTSAIPGGSYTELRPERGWQQRASPVLTGSTIGTLPGKWGKKGEERYIEEAAGILRYFYDLVFTRYDFDKSILAYAEEVLRRSRGLLEGEKVHIKRGYVKLTPRVAAVVYASFFVSVYNLARGHQVLGELFYHLVQYLSQTKELRGNAKKAREKLQEELKQIMPHFVKYMIPP